jgi:predicted amidohydrolase YtcJ
MYTFDAAYSSSEENVKGSIEEGKLADLTILSGNPMAVEPEKIKDTKVEFVIIDGKILIS